MFETILSGAIIDASIPLTTAVIAIAEALLLGLMISFTYIKTADKISYSKNFSLTLILIPTIIAIIILLIGSNIARAFSLAGAFSIIRFRSAPGNPKDISYVFFTMAAGLACGAECFAYALMFTVILCIIMFILHAVNFGEKSASEQLLKITIPENLDYQGVFDDILSKYTHGYKLSRVKTVDLGSLFELDYNITVPADADCKKFIDELRQRNGNLSITMVMAENNTEF